VPPAFPHFYIPIQKYKSRKMEINLNFGGQIYTNKNCLEEFAKIHKYLWENEENLGKLMRNSIEREKMAR
jgi:hypothetical protein